jgi:lipopolysaccharide exporter
MSTTRIARGAAWTIASSVISRALGLIGTLILTRFVARQDYGEVSAAVMVVLTINQFTTLGVGIYVITAREITREEVFHATVIHVSLALIALLTLLVVGKPLSPVFDTPNMYLYVPGLALAAFADRLTFMPERMLIRRLSFRSVGLYRSAGELIYTLASVMAAALGLGGMSIVIGNLARSLARGALFCGSVPMDEWLHWTRLRWAVIRRIANYGLTILGAVFAAFAARRWDNLLIARFFGPATMADYNLAYNLADIPAVHIGEQLCDVMQASFAHMDSADRKRTLLRSLGVIALVTFPLAVGLGVVGPTLAAVLLNANWAAVGPMLLILAALSLARPLFGAISALLLVEVGPRLLTLIEWLTLALLIGSLVSFGRLSPLWACAAVGIAYVVRTLAAIVVAQRRAGVGTAEFVARLGPPLLACIPMVAAILAVRVGLENRGVTAPAVRLAAEILAGAVTFAAAALVLARGPVNDLLSLIRDRRRRLEDPAVASVPKP